MTFAMFFVGDELAEQPIRAGRGAEVLPQFLAAGGALNDQDEEHSAWTLLHFASEHGDLELLDVLIEAGADLNMRDRNGATPLWIAVDSDCDGHVQFHVPITFDATKRLLAGGAGPAIANDNGKTPTDLVARYGAAAIKQFETLVAEHRRS